MSLIGKFEKIKPQKRDIVFQRPGNSLNSERQTPLRQWAHFPFLTRNDIGPSISQPSNKFCCRPGTTIVRLHGPSLNWSLDRVRPSRLRSQRPPAVSIDLTLAHANRGRSGSRTGAPRTAPHACRSLQLDTGRPGDQPPACCSSQCPVPLRQHGAASRVSSWSVP